MKTKKSRKKSLKIPEIPENSKNSGKIPKIPKISKIPKNSIGILASYTQMVSGQPFAIRLDICKKKICKAPSFVEG